MVALEKLDGAAQRRPQRVDVLLRGRGGGSRPRTRGGHDFCQLCRKLGTSAASLRQQTAGRQTEQAAAAAAHLGLGGEGDVWPVQRGALRLRRLAPARDAAATEAGAPVGRHHAGQLGAQRGHVAGGDAGREAGDELGGAGGGDAGVGAVQGHQVVDHGRGVQHGVAGGAHARGLHATAAAGGGGRRGGRRGHDGGVVEEEGEPGAARGVAEDDAVPGVGEAGGRGGGASRQLGEVDLQAEPAVVVGAQQARHCGVGREEERQGGGGPQAGGVLEGQGGGGEGRSLEPGVQHAGGAEGGGGGQRQRGKGAHVGAQRGGRAGAAQRGAGLVDGGAKRGRGPAVLQAAVVHHLLPSTEIFRGGCAIVASGSWTDAREAGLTAAGWSTNCRLSAEPWARPRAMHSSRGARARIAPGRLARHMCVTRAATPLRAARVLSLERTGASWAGASFVVWASAQHRHSTRTQQASRLGATRLPQTLRQSPKHNYKSTPHHTPFTRDPLLFSSQPCSVWPRSRRW